MPLQKVHRPNRPSAPPSWLCCWGFWSWSAGAIGFSELIGSWLAILGLLKPLTTLMAGLNTHVLELVVLHLEGNLALLFNGPGRFSFDAGMGSELISGLDQGGGAPETDQPGGFGALTPAVIALRAFRQAD